jgi:hypothetical protein
MPRGRGHNPLYLLAPVLLALAAAPVEAAPRPAAPPAQPEAADAPWFQVAGVAADDVLNIRAAPGASYPVVGTIPPDAREVAGTGRTAPVGPSLWREVVYGRMKGWVNSRFLVESADPRIPAPDPPAAEAPPPSPAAEAPPPSAPATLPTSALPMPVDPDAQGAGEGLERRLVCYLTPPLWRLEINQGGPAFCDDKCDGGADLRTGPPAPVKGKPNAWNVDIRRPDATVFASIALERTGTCQDEMVPDPYPYEVTLRRPGKKPTRGCCKGLPGAAGENAPTR